ncbi:Sensitive to high expression protein 9 [Penicillium rolfsii]|nr:Sensitive to high expression protein 9 [Penicillium rolfsii]
MCSSDIFLAILAVFFPPIAVWIKAGICTADSIINIALCLLGYIPGLIHAWYIIMKYPDQDYDDVAYEPIPGGSSQRRDLENGRVTYYYVSHQPLQHPSQRQSYGTVNQQGQQENASSNAPKPSGHTQQGAGASSGEGGSETRPPPTYAEAVKGDNKIQSQESSALISAMQSMQLLLRQSLRSNLRPICTTTRPLQLPHFRPTSSAFPARPTTRSFSVCLQCQFRRLPGLNSPAEEKDKTEAEIQRIIQTSNQAVVPDGVPDSDAAAGTPRASSKEADVPPAGETQMKSDDKVLSAGLGTEAREGKTQNTNAQGTPSGGLPSYLENRRSQLSKQFTTMMDNLQSNVFVAGQRLNDLTGYSAIEALKKDIQTQEAHLRTARAHVRKAKEEYTAAINNRSNSQREVNELLQRKHAWSPTDLERFTLLYRNDHANEVAEVESQEALSRAEREAEEAAASLNKSILSRYHEEQVWSDKIRRMSTWGTWGLMGMNVLLFLIFQIAVEPWRRRRLVKGFEDKVVEALEKEKNMNRIEGVVSSAAAPTILPEVIDSTVESSIASIESPAAETDEPAVIPVVAPAEASPVEASPSPDPIDEQYLTSRLAGITLSPISLGYWRQVFDELFSERTVAISQRDITVVAMQSAAAGAAVVGLMISLVRSR